MERLEEDFGIIDWWKKVVLENYANFEGRARRKEFWMFQLINVLVIFIGMFLFGVISGSVKNSSSEFALIPLGLLALYLLLIFLPALAVTIRRLHDTNRSGWYYLLSFIPYAGGIIMLIFYVSEGTVGPNQYGYDPKRPTQNNEIDEIGQIQE
ncbi:DUF805 domain-containing protein [Flavobacterium sediminis]|uniref:DUF805 domain-containing protein n=1 Tax=Flavobacterium sediminis TaxID=2201181 RepID=UPI001C54E854|nr:DUF805 domain-containing protein [Flavobacterium sediminis]